MEFLNNINLDNNQIFNLVLERLAAHPTSPVEGRIYYNDTDKNVYYRKDNAWVPWVSGVETVTPGTAMNNTGTSTNPILNVLTDNVTIGVNGSNQTYILDGGVSTAKVADFAITTNKVAGGAITFAKLQNIPTMTVLGRVVGGAGEASAIGIVSDLSNASSTTLATSSSMKAYVDAAIAGIGTLIGGFNASTSTDFPGTASTKKGDYWYVTAPGTVQGEAFATGDVIVANKANPSKTAKADYIFLETNRDAATTTILGLVKLGTAADVQNGVGQGVVTAETLAQRTATETRTGLVAKASDAEFTAGTENTKFVTAYQVRGMFNSLGAFTALVGTGSATSIVVSHPLNTRNVVPALYRVSTNRLVHTTMEATSAGTFTCIFSKPPATNEFRLVLTSK